MSSSQARLVSIVTGSEFEDQIIASLQKLGARGYTCWEVRGRGLHGKRESALWDGTNIQIQVIAEPELAERIMKHLADEYLPDTPLKAYMLPVEAIPAGDFG